MRHPESQGASEGLPPARHFHREPLSLVTKIFERKPRVFQDLEEQSLRKISCMDGNHEGLAGGMFQNQVRTGLADSAITLAEKKTNEFANGDHSV